MSLWSTIDRYIFRQTLARVLALSGITLIALLLERVVRLINLTVNSDQSFTLLAGMLMNLVPHYLGLALPAALFIGVWMAFARLGEDSELDALYAAGAGLPRLILPVIVLAIVLTVITGLIFTILQPYSRYAYRSLIYSVTHASISAALQEGAFIQIGDLTLMAERVSGHGKELRRVFIHREQPDGRSVTTTAKSGVLRESEKDLRSVLSLSDGLRISRRPKADAPDTLSFTQYNRPIGPSGIEAFRERGNDQRELTLFELWAARFAPPDGVTPAKMVAEFHARIVRTLSTLFMPLLAAPLAIGRRRGTRSYGLVFGLVVLVAYEELLQFGESFSALGQISPLAGLWLPLAMFAIGGSLLFCRVAFKTGGNPLAYPAAVIDEVIDGIRQNLMRISK